VDGFLLRTPQKTFFGGTVGSNDLSSLSFVPSFFASHNSSRLLQSQFIRYGQPGTLQRIPNPVDTCSHRCCRRCCCCCLVAIRRRRRRQQPGQLIPRHDAHQIGTAARIVFRSLAGVAHQNSRAHKTRRRRGGVVAWRRRRRKQNLESRDVGETHYHQGTAIGVFAAIDRAGHPVVVEKEIQRARARGRKQGWHRLLVGVVVGFVPGSSGIGSVTGARPAVVVVFTGDYPGSATIPRTPGPLSRTKRKRGTGAWSVRGVPWLLWQRRASASASATTSPKGAIGFGSATRPPLDIQEGDLPEAFRQQRVEILRQSKGRRAKLVRWPGLPTPEPF